MTTTARDVIRTAIRTEIRNHFGTQEGEYHPFAADLAERIDEALSEQHITLPGIALADGGESLTAHRELEALRDQVRRLPLSLSNVMGEMVVVRLRRGSKAQHVHAPTIAALLRSEGTHHEE